MLFVLNDIHLILCLITEILTPIQGIAPYSFDYEIVAGKSREAFSVENVTDSLHRMDIPLPTSIAEKGGQISLSLGMVFFMIIGFRERRLTINITHLVKILDGRGCRRSLSVPDLYIDVHRSKPTVSFYGHDNVRSTTIRMGESAHLPLRLTGIAVRLLLSLAKLTTCFC